ncbi:hypothetical protein [Nocardia sp. NPDC005366]|uniref:hypothetical protein n=1 Tax=Nocardia sp. NPDC005366 TaxID=3156878 RepID=UPI0033AFC651
MGRVRAVLVTVPRAYPRNVTGGVVQQVDAVVARARVARDVGRPEQARELLGAALVRAPQDPTLLAEIADVSYSPRRFDDALRYAGQAIAVAPHLAGPHVTAALTYDVFYRHDDALRHARLAVRLEPHDLDALLALAFVIVTVGAALGLGVIVVLWHWSRQPAAFWVLVTVLCVIALTLLLETLIALCADLPRRVRWIPVLVAAVPIAVVCGGLWWGAHEVMSEPFRSAERLPRPSVPRFTPKPLPTMPSFRVTVPTTPPPPPGDR